MKVNERSIAVLGALAALLLWAPGARAQGGSPAAAPVKTGVLNVRQAIVSTAEGKQASAELQSQFSARQTELDNMRRQVEDLQNRLRTGGDKMSPEERGRLQRQGELLSRQFQRKQDDLQEELNNAQGDVIDRIGRKMLEVLDRYARENGYSVVFDTSAQNTPVIYASNQIDITQDIVRLYDQAYPVKGGTTTPARPQPGTATKPPATRPAQPPVQKPPQQ